VTRAERKQRRKRSECGRLSVVALVENNNNNINNNNINNNNNNMASPLYLAL
jgi:hypothetical protein